MNQYPTAHNMFTGVFVTATITWLFTAPYPAFSWQYHYEEFLYTARCSRMFTKDTAAAAPPLFRPSEPALCGSCPLVTPYYCRLGDLLCFVFIVRLVYFSVIDVLYVSLQYFHTIGWVCWPIKTVARITYTVLVETLNHAQQHCKFSLECDSERLENRPVFDKIMYRLRWLTFLAHPVQVSFCSE